jgi:hypothetical protein
VEDSEGFKHHDYDGKGQERRGNVEWRDERRRREAEEAKDQRSEEETEEAKDIREYDADVKSRTNSRHRTRSRSKTPTRGLHLNALGLMMITVPTAEALNQQAMETIAAYLPTIWTLVALTVITAIIIANAATKEAGPERQTNEARRKKPSTKGNGRGRSATPKRTSIGDLKRKAQNEMDEAHADGRLTLETTLARTWEEIHGHAWQRFKGFEDQAWTNFNEKTKVEAKGFKAFYERMEELEDADSGSHLPTDDECPWNKSGIICRCASAYEVDASGYEKVTKELNRPGTAIMMGKSKFSAITMMMCTDVAEACNINDAMEWTTVVGGQGTCDYPILNWMMITAGIVILVVIINALTDMALEAGGEQIFVKTTVKERKRGTPSKDKQDREQHRHKRAALVLTAMLVATTVATSNAELMSTEPTKGSNLPVQAMHRCRDPRSHTTKVEWRQNGHMVMAHATVVNVNQPTNAIGDGPYDPRANVPQRPHWKKSSKANSIT